MQEWSDCTELSSCCVGGFVCYEQSSRYWQCLKQGTCPSSGWKCTEKVVAQTPTPAAATGCSVEEWGQCGGQRFASANACCTGSLVCYEKNQWYAQCRISGTCPNHWDCSVKGATTSVPVPPAGDACGCDGNYRYGASAQDSQLCKLRKNVFDQQEGRKAKWCDPVSTAASSPGGCDASMYKACGEKQVLRLLIKAAKQDLLTGGFQNAVQKAIRVEAKKLVMRWICPAAVCEHGCPEKQQQRVLAGCLAGATAPARRDRPLQAPAAGDSGDDEWVAGFDGLSDEEAIQLGEAVQSIAHGWDADNADLDDLRRYVTPRSNLNIASAPDAAADAGLAAPDEPAAEGGSSPGAVAALAGGAACLLVSGVAAALLVARRRNAARGGGATDDNDGDMSGVASVDKGQMAFRELEDKKGDKSENKAHSI